MTLFSFYKVKRCPHLFVGDRNEPVFGQLSQDVEVRPHVQFAANQHHFGIRAELLSFSLPLCVSGRQMDISTQTLL